MRYIKFSVKILLLTYFWLLQKSMAPWITISSLHTLSTVQVFYIFTVVWYSVKQGNTKGPHYFLETLLCPLSAASWTNTSAADTAGQCRLWWLSSLVMLAAAEHDLPTKLGWGDLSFFQLLQSNSTAREFWNLGEYILPHSFSFLVQSQGTCLLCWAVLYRMNLFYVCFSHQKVLTMKRNCS
jgi:hypothetical protein